MRALSVSLRTRRLPMKMMRSMIVPTGCGGGSWKEGSVVLLAANSAVTFAEPVESNAEESEDGDATPFGLRGTPARAEDASNNSIAANQSRTRLTPNGKGTLLEAANEGFTL